MIRARGNASDPDRRLPAACRVGCTDCSGRDTGADHSLLSDYVGCDGGEHVPVLFL